MAKVVGLGGVFFKSENPQKLREWYKFHLGLDSEEWGAVFKWDLPKGKDYYNVWSPFPTTTEYLKPSEKPFMINFIVDDCFALIEQLKSSGQNVVGEPEESEFGRFGWVII
ncbi:MAG: VOC family protein [Bacteroidetes bacterium]|nr:VOC family protein [Bacteroidota bacterium]